MILLPHRKRIQNGAPRCENLACPERSGGAAGGSRGVIVEAGVPEPLTWKLPGGVFCQRTVLLCTFCLEEARSGKAEIKVLEK